LLIRFAIIVRKKVVDVILLKENAYYVEALG